jgi:hypothetical protein
VIFAIRDDDASFFTRPSDLEQCYADIWDVCPVSLSCVPFHACTRSEGIPEENWDGSEVFPLGDNEELVRFLRSGIKSGRLSVSLHGYSHRDEPDGYEFETGAELASKVQEGKEYLERLLGTRIHVFVPPHNALSRTGRNAVVAAGMSSCGGAFGQRDLLGVFEYRALIRKKLWHLAHGYEYPYPLRFSGHAEINHHSVTPTADPSNLVRALERTMQDGGVFCAATHYWEFPVESRVKPGVSVRDLLYGLFERARSDGGVDFLSLDQIAARWQA